MKIEEFPTAEDGMDEYDWREIVEEGADVDRSLREVVTGDDKGQVSPERIVAVTHLWVERGDLAEMEMHAVCQLTDGWGAVSAGCDTTGWGCQAGGDWRWAPTYQQVVQQGLTRDARKLLGLAS